MPIEKLDLKELGGGRRVGGMGREKEEEGVQIKSCLMRKVCA